MTILTTGIDDIPVVGGAIGAAADAVTGTVGAVTSGIGDAIDFASDPLGFALERTHESNVVIATKIMPAMMRALTPDLTLKWFIDAYKVSFGIAVIVWVFLLFFAAYRTAKGRLESEKFFEILTSRSLEFWVISMFAPAAGISFVALSHAMSDYFLSAWFDTTGNGVLGSLQTMLDTGQPIAANMGALLASVMELAMLVALVLVIVMLFLALIALYFSGVVFPLTQMWRVSEDHEHLARKAIGVWLGILAAEPLLIFLLGVAFAMAGDSISGTTDEPWLTDLTRWIAAVLAMGVSALAPALLLKFAPHVMPGNSGGAIPGAGGGSTGAGSPGQAADQQAAMAPTSGGSTSSTSDGGPGPLEAAAMEQQASGGGASGGTEGMSSSVSTVGMSSSEVAGGGVGGGLGAGAGAGAAGAGAATAGGAEAAAGGLAAAGAAESATGAGAVVGVPTLALAGLMAAGQKATEATKSVGELATGDVDGSGA